MYMETCAVIQNLTAKNAMTNYLKKKKNCLIGILVVIGFKI